MKLFIYLELIFFVLLTYFCIKDEPSFKFKDDTMEVNFKFNMPHPNFYKFQNVYVQSCSRTYPGMIQIYSEQPTPTPPQSLHLIHSNSWFKPQSHPNSTNSLVVTQPILQIRDNREQHMKIAEQISHLTEM